MVNRIQNLRKDAGLEVTDKIAVQVVQHDLLEKAVEANKAYVMEETLSDTLDFVPTLSDGQILAFDTIETTIVLNKL